MKKGKILTNDHQLKKLLENTKTIAVLGLSPKPERDSNMVARYLKRQGYRIIPVRPGQEEILGETAVASLAHIKEPVDIINVFRNPALVPGHALEALNVMPKAFWMQLNIESLGAAEILTEAGIDVIMNACIKVEHERLF